MKRFIEGHGVMELEYTKDFYGYGSMTHVCMMTSVNYSLALRGWPVAPTFFNTFQTFKPSSSLVSSL